MKWTLEYPYFLEAILGWWTKVGETHPYPEFPRSEEVYIGVKGDWTLWSWSEWTMWGRVLETKGLYRKKYPQKSF